MNNFESMPDWVKEKRQSYVLKAKAAPSLDAIFLMYFYNHHDCHGQQPKIQIEEILSGTPAEEELQAAYKKCAALISDGYVAGEALYQARGSSEEYESIIQGLKARNPGFSQASYERALRHGQTAARF